MPPLPRPSQTGLTLIELLAGSVALGVLLLLALPLLARSLDTLNADLLRWQLHTALATARNTAIVQQRAVGLCASRDGRTCGKDWNQGWLLYRLPPGLHGTGAGTVKYREFLRHHRRDGAGAVTARTTVGRGALQFRADGRSSGTTATISVCVGKELRSTVVMSVAGRIQSAREKKYKACPK